MIKSNFKSPTEMEQQRLATTVASDFAHRFHQKYQGKLELL
jgi:hypothetical protein